MQNLGLQKKKPLKIHLNSSFKIHEVIVLLRYRLWYNKVYRSKEESKILDKRFRNLIL